MHKKPYVSKERMFVLASNWKPKTLSKSGLQWGIRKLLKENGITPERWKCTVRNPIQNKDIYTDFWHQDVGGIPIFMVLWTNKCPTQLRVKGDDTVFTPKPNDVIMFHNADYIHRQNPKARRCRTRWFVRQFVQIKEAPRKFSRGKSKTSSKRDARSLPS